MNRADHLAWCKRRALEYCESGDLQNALASMLSDLGKHEETRDHPARQLMVQMTLGGHLTTPQAMREFIEGFN